MEEKVIISGVGGQGSLLIGKLMGYSATSANKYASFLPQYGAQKRGGLAECSVVLSDKPIISPIIGLADSVIAFDPKSLEANLHKIKPNGKLFVNSSMCEVNTERKDIEIIKLPVDDLAREMGSKQVANMIMLGAFIIKTGTFTAEEVNHAIEKMLAKKPKFIDINKKAVIKGTSLV